MADPFAGSGEMRALCRAHEWSSTPLGPVESWSHSLRTTVGVVLGSRHPMFLFWGPELVQFYNDAYRPSFGYGQDSRHPRALGMRGRECWTDIWPVIGPQIEQVMTTGEATWHEDQYLPIERNGRLDDVWWTYSYSPVQDDDGRIAATLVVCQETTGRLQAEAARRESDARYRSLLESLDQGFCVIEMIFDGDGKPVDYRWTETNPAFPEQTGLKDAVGRTARELVPNLEGHWPEVYGEVALTGEPTRFVSGSDAMGRVFDVFAFRFGAAEKRQVALLFTDITAARAAELERDRLHRDLEVERTRLAMVFQQAPAFLAVVRGPELVFDLVNEAYYQLVGHRELIGRPVFEALPEARNQGFEELLHGVLASGEPFVGREMPLLIARRPGGPQEERFVDLTYLPLVEGDGARTGIIAHGTDVTDHVHARREIERLLGESEQARRDADLSRADAESARTEAEAANRAKGDFLAVMSHELRTPLNAIGGYAELLEMGIRGPVTVAQREDLRRIQTSQRHLLGLINEVLNYAKLETGTVNYDIGDISVAEAVATAESLVAPQARTKKLSFVVSGGPAELSVRADAEKFRQILVNLLSNAVKFTDRGGAVDLRWEGDEDRVRIIVRDNGIGIAADRLEDVFEPFIQVRSDLAREAEGTGLGLAISRDLARAMGGDITAESTPGVGSSFSLALPRA